MVHVVVPACIGWCSVQQRFRGESETPTIDRDQDGLHPNQLGCWINALCVSYCCCCSSAQIDLSERASSKLSSSTRETLWRYQASKLESYMRMMDPSSFLLQQYKKLRWKKYRSRHLLHLLMHARHILGSLAQLLPRQRLREEGERSRGEFACLLACLSICHFM